MDDKHSSCFYDIDSPETNAALDDHPNAQSSENLLQDYESQRSWRPWLKRPIFIAGCCHSVILLILASVLVFTAHRQSQDTTTADFGHFLLQSPAKEAVKYERAILDHNLNIENPFKGEPRPEQDKAWDDLLQYQNLAIAQDELDVPGSVKVNDGTDRVVFNLDVFHNLHCLNYVRRYIFRSYYKDQFPESDRNGHLDHIGHCIDMMRQSIMCAGDIAISTYDWKMDHLRPWPNFRVAHECKNWDSIVEWARKHKAPSLYGDMLVHPKYGW